MKIPAQKYLKDNGVDLKRVAKRYAFIFFKMNLFIDQFALKGKVVVNRRMLAEAIHDYYVDTIRVKDFHGIEYTGNSSRKKYSKGQKRK